LSGKKKLDERVKPHILNQQKITEQKKASYTHDTLLVTSNSGTLSPARIENADYFSIYASIFSTLLLRVTSRVSFVLLGFYLGAHFSSAAMVALILESFYITELLLAPIAGSLSDRYGRKPFLLFAPICGSLAAFCLWLSTWIYPHPNFTHMHMQLLELLALILFGRLLEGVTTALNTPASLGYITDATTGLSDLRTKVMTAFEVVTVGGIALAIPFGGLISKWLGNWGFLVVIGLHIFNALVIVFCLREKHYRVQQANKYNSLTESFKMLRDKHIFTFLPAWLSINTLVGAWITLIVIMLTYANPAADLRYPHQLLYGGFSKDTATLTFGGFCLFFLLGMGVWIQLAPRLRRTTIMLIGLVGLVLCILSLTLINGLGENLSTLSSQAYIALFPLLFVLLVGTMLLSGFTPASLNQLAAIAELKRGRGGAVMGLYSVILGVGQLVGASVGGVCVDHGGFYGLMAFSAVLGIFSLCSVLYMRFYRHDLL
jgi:MFS family permease